MFWIINYCFLLVVVPDLRRKILICGHSYIFWVAQWAHRMAIGSQFGLSKWAVVEWKGCQGLYWQGLLLSKGQITLPGEKVQDLWCPNWILECTCSGVQKSHVHGKICTALTTYMDDCRWQLYWNAKTDHLKRAHSQQFTLCLNLLYGYSTLHLWERGRTTLVLHLCRLWLHSCNHCSPIEVISNDYSFVWKEGEREEVYENKWEVALWEGRWWAEGWMNFCSLYLPILFDKNKNKK